MESNVKALRKALQERRAELQQLVDQMKSDQLQRSSVYRNLENELAGIREKLQNPEVPKK
jgi:hypothetical protein